MSPEKIHSKEELENLNQYLESRSYIEGYTPSKSDAVVYDALANVNAQIKNFDHLARWFKHIQSFGSKKENFLGEQKSIAQLNVFGSTTGAHKDATVCGVTADKKKPAANDDDIDLFGSDDEDDAAAEELKAQRLAEYQAKKATKPKVIAKSSVIIDVKPWEDTTDMKQMEESVRAITMDGLIWGTAKLVPIGYGIRKLQISCAIEDEKVSMDNVEEQILAIEDLVQSMDIVSFNKI